MRIVGSLTTIPNRVQYLIPILKNLLKLPLDKIHVNIPNQSRVGQKYVLYNDLKQLIESNPRLQLNRGKDYGPITKLIPTLIQEQNPNTRIITFDDDILVDPKIVSILVEGSKRHPNSAIGFSGVSWGKFPFNYQNTRKASHDCQVDWLEGVYSVIYQRKFFDLDELLLFPPSHLKESLGNNDDHWISAYLSSRGISRWSLGVSTQGYFVDTPSKRIQGLSRRGLTLVQEHSQIIQTFVHRQIYYQNHPEYSSLIYIWVLIILILFILICYF